MKKIVNRLYVLDHVLDLEVWALLQCINQQITSFLVFYNWNFKCAIQSFLMNHMRNLYAFLVYQIPNSYAFFVGRGSYYQVRL